MCIMKILFTRHGRTAVNVRGRVHQVGDAAGLDRVGKRQIEKVARVFQQQKVEVIYSSPERRAVESAQIIGGKLNIKPIIESGLAERNWGEWSQKTWEEVLAQLQTMSLEERYSFIPPGGESWEQAEIRLADSVNEIIKRPHKVTAIITHGGVMRVLMPVLKNEPKESSFRYDFLNGSITSFEYKNGRWRLISENDVSHLIGVDSG